MISGIQLGLFLSALVPEPSVNRLFTFKLQLASVCSNGKRENSPIKQIIKFPFEKNCSTQAFLSAVHYSGCLVCYRTHPQGFHHLDRIHTGSFVTADNLEKQRSQQISRALRFQNVLMCWEATAISLLAFERSCRLQYRAPQSGHRHRQSGMKVNCASSENKQKNLISLASITASTLRGKETLISFIIINLR